MKQLNFGSTNGKPNDPNKTVVHCPTQELAQKVLRVADRIWDGSETKMHDNDEWEYYGKETCYDLNNGLFSNKNWYVGGGYTILPAEEFIRLNTEVEKENSNPFKIGDRVFHHLHLWGVIENIDGQCCHIDAKRGYYQIHYKYLSFTEYHLQGFSQERPKELDFDASCLPAWANKFIAMDSDYVWVAFIDEPDECLTDWQVGDESYACPIPLDFAPKNFQGNWKDSLHEIKDGKAVKYSLTNPLEEK